MLGAMASLCLPDARRVDANASSLYADALQTTLVERFRVQVPIVPWPAPPRRLVRVSAQLYNELPQYALLARALREALDREALEIDIDMDAESEPPKSS
jgi:isopenicillin-N epimerase